MKKDILIIITFIVFLSGCKKETIDVPDEFNAYFQRFEKEAELRGKSINVEEIGLKVEFADFTGKDYVGLTNYENPVRIQIDKDYWNSTSEINRELVLFHEFGHGLLGIHGHRNDTLPNGYWKSIMSGKPANTISHKTGYEIHRAYYLDELFLDIVKTPAWSYRPAIIVLSSKDNDFGLLPLNTGKSKMLKLKNTGNHEVFIDSIKASTCFYSNFTGSIQPHDSINIGFIFTPTEQKQYSGAIEIVHSIANDTFFQPLTFELKGEGSGSSAIGEWTVRAPFPGAARFASASFSINGNGFVCLGTTYSGNNTSEIWKYGADNQWVKKNNFPGVSRDEPIGFSINGKGYVGLGSNRNDFWEYDYTTDTWSKKGDFPGQARILGVCLSTSAKGYFGLGNSGTSLFKDFWEYNPVSDQWTQLPDYPGQANSYAAAFAVNDRIFVGTGCDGNSVDGHAHSDFWEFNATTKEWIKKSDFARGKTTSAVSFAINNYGYLSGGSKDDGTGYDNSFWEYDPVKDTWSKKAYMPDVSFGGVFYSIGDKGYYGLGFMTSPYYWEFNPGR